MSDSRIDVHPILRLLAEMAARGASAPVTLFVNGTTICGHLTTEQEFLQDLGKKIAQGFRTSELPDDYRTKIADTIDAAMRDKIGNDNRFNSDGPYLFLRGVRILHNGTLAPERGSVSWCGRIDSIDGFAWGVLGMQSD